MYRYSIAEVTLNNSLNAAPCCLAEIHSSATDYISIVESEIRPKGVGLAAFGLGIPSANGVGPDAQYDMVCEDTSGPADTSVYIATDWSVPPTVPTKFYRRFTTTTLAAGVASPVPLRFRSPRGFRIAPGSSMVLWLISQAASGLILCDWHIVIEL